MLSLFISSKDSKVSWLQQALKTAVEFDEKIVYLDGIRVPIDGLLNQFSYYGEPCVLVGDGQHRDLKDGFNYAFKNTSKDADWVCHFCDDDYFIESNLSELVKKINQGEYYDCDVSHFPCELDDGSLWGSSYVSYSSLMESNVIPYASFIRRKVWEDVGGYKVNCWGDWNLWLRIAKAGYRFEFFPLPVFHFRQYSESSTVEMLGGDRSHNIRQAVLNTL